MDRYLGFILSFIVAFVAYKKGSLTQGGWIGAMVLGGFIYLWGGILYWSLLISFFLSSSILTKLNHKLKIKEIDIIQEKGGKRDIIQVLANGSLPLIFSLLYAHFQLDLFYLGGVVALATSTADTWASELGVLSRGKTVSVLTWKPITKGLSGGVSIMGTFAALGGAVFIAAIFSFGASISQFAVGDDILVYSGLIIMGGFIGCFVDSYLGALLQAKYRGVISGIITEKSIIPNEGTILISGLRFMTNDVVNITSALLSSFVAFLYLL